MGNARDDQVGPSKKDMDAGIATSQVGPSMKDIEDGIAALRNAKAGPDIMMEDGPRMLRARSPLLENSLIDAHMKKIIPIGGGWNHPSNYFAI